LIKLTVQESSSVYELAAVKSCFAHFFGLIMLYGMFIPNTWRRALAVTLPIAATPPFLLGWLRYQSHEFQAFALEVIGSDQVADHLMMMTLGIAAVSYNAYSISRLRRREFQARQIGQYHLIRSIGSGGMGEVFLAEHQLLKRPCAIKLIKPSNQMDPKAMARFEQEVQTTANLSHWNTIDVYDYGRTDDGTFYYVMEYLPGMNLSDLVEKHGPIPPGRLIHLLRQTCQALSEAHHIGLIHRDIKPANIFAAERGGNYDVAKLLDFGLVKPMTSDSDMQLTQEGACVGSPLYMSPEQATIQRETDGRSDIYSLGATAYFALTGRPPFEGRNPLQLVVAHSRDPVPPPSQFAPDLPQDLEAVILKCLEKEPEK
ncbi:MAG: serine/threonine protein kinase, partial [Planctomycetaceae bacterium]|nr:serine/threonine protein kinase [Planctomycetaceae bacterium]